MVEEQFDAHNPKHIERKQQESKEARDQHMADMKWLLEHPQGRRIAWRLIGDAGTFQASMTGNSWTFFNEGKRSVGSKFFADVMNADPKAFEKMTAENSKGESK